MTRRLAAASLMALLLGSAAVFAQAPPPVPTLPDAQRQTIYTLSASTCACAIGFALYGDGTDYQNWLQVYVGSLLVAYNDPGFGWTVTSPSGALGNIARPITDAVLTFTQTQTGTITIVGFRRPRRLIQFQENRGISAHDLNEVLSDIVAQHREIWDHINALPSPY